MARVGFFDAESDVSANNCKPWEAEILRSFQAVEALPEVALQPRYRQIYTVLKQAMTQGGSPPERLPHERLLAAHFGAARVTVRKALAVLTEEGRLCRTCGRGTFVIVPSSNPGRGA